MAVNRDHVAGLLIKASLALHFVDILGSAIAARDQKKMKKTQSKSKNKNKQKTENQEKRRIINFTQYNCRASHTNTHLCCASEKWQKANLITTKWLLWPGPGSGPTHIAIGSNFVIYHCTNTHSSPRQTHMPAFVCV